MLYRHEQSVLGFGCMRFPRKGNGFDMDEVEKEIRFAHENGVNYFDTAYIYPGSEAALGQVVDKLQIRKDIKIATKLPHYMMKDTAEMEKRFREQLTRLKTDYVDNYLMHMLPDPDIWKVLLDRGVLNWVADKKASGQIRNVGFSYHGSSGVFQDLLHAHDWDFCQIQYNYMDENAQAGRSGLKEAASMGIPVIIMEPLRGGKLAKLPPDASALLKKAHPDWSDAEWSFRWLYDQPEVTTVLSGMNSMEMLEENIRIAAQTEAHSLTEADHKALSEAKDIIQKSILVPCTGCSYCMPCPAGVDIPGCFRFYNSTKIDGYANAFREYFMCTAMKTKPAYASLCRQCGKCETHCPQHIQIRQELKRVKRKFDNPIFHIGRFFANRLGKK
ncbi:MAG: aldo/keto reductase [Lachnospiraceae bacterium]|nr:aldo/keto reductase [Lachnospiraceae bacterium]